jgi:two-component system, NarL family, sensor histidine kinase BarA
MNGSLSDARITDTPELAQLLDAAALDDVCRTFSACFGLPVRVFASDGALFAAAYAEGAELSDERTSELPIRYDGRALGRLVLGPVGADAPHALDKLALHFSAVLDALLFSGHRALLASTMHLASAEASYRELAQQNARLQAAYDKLKELDRLKSTFLATMSHELRTPLTSIIGYSDMLANGMGGELNPTQREFVDTVRAKADHLLELILALLDVAKLEQDQVRLQLLPIDPGALIADVLRTVSPAATKKQLKIEQLLPPELPYVRADQLRLRQVLLNLLDNAVKFTPKGGTIQLEVAHAQLASRDDAEGAGLVLLGGDEPALEFRVRDTGIGIPAEEHERIFDAFYQVDGSPTREHGGTGLGLSIVKRLVEAHSGAIEVVSEPGRGSEFRVRLPLA